MPAEPLDWLAPGSWANANFSIWIGHPEDHEAWRWILRAREALMNRRGSVPQDHWDLAYEELLIAEGSDWMWWFGNDFSSDRTRSSMRCSASTSEMSIASLTSLCPKISRIRSRRIWKAAGW